eukprot:GAHX01002807.1.p1 GENE.GAHX01002807.1~~GAHX01002807.1.p1  ORF type:complete len:393 (-),score=91.00 GAHX01002807.1:403-1581(-)
MESERITSPRHSISALKWLVLFVLVLFVAIASLAGTYFYMFEKELHNNTNMAVSTYLSAGGYTKEHTESIEASLKEIEIKLEKLTELKFDNHKSSHSVSDELDNVSESSYDSNNEHNEDNSERNNYERISNTAEANSNTNNLISAIDVLQYLREVFGKNEHNLLIQIHSSTDNDINSINNKANNFQDKHEPMSNIILPIKLNTEQYIDFLIYQRNHINNNESQTEFIPGVVNELEYEIGMRKQMLVSYFNISIQSYLSTSENAKTEQKEKDVDEIMNELESENSTNFDSLIQKFRDNIKLIQRLYVQNICELKMKNIPTNKQNTNKKKKIKRTKKKKQNEKEKDIFETLINDKVGLFAKNYNDLDKEAIKLINNNCNSYTELLGQKIALVRY